MPKNKIYCETMQDDEERDSLMFPCFQIGSDVLLKDVPTTGEEYLLKVKFERERCARVTTCNRDYSKFARNQSLFVKELPHAKAPDNLKPTIEWQNIQIADFSEVRMYISKLLNKKSEWKQNLIKININKGSRDAEWKNFFETKDATLSCVMGINQVFIDRGLEILIEILDNVNPAETINHKTGQWIYALLACTRQPLVSDTVSILRDLARKCAKIRSHLDPEDENSVSATIPLSLFICLVSRYFRQYDLAD